MFEDLFGKPTTKKVAPKKGGMFAGLFGEVEKPDKKYIIVQGMKVDPITRKPIGLAPTPEEGPREFYLERAPEIPEEKDTWLKKIGRFLLPRSLEVKFGLAKPDVKEQMMISEDARLSYLREQEFVKLYEKEVTKAPEIPKEYKEPTGFFGQLFEGMKSGYQSSIKAGFGYFAESFGRQLGSRELLKWGQKLGDKTTIDILKQPELYRPEDLKPYFEGGAADPRWYGRTIGETIPFITGTIAMATLGGLVGGVPGALIGGYGSVYALEKGNSYKEMIDRGIAPDKADLASTVYGTIASAIENAFGIAPAKIGQTIFTKPAKTIVYNSFTSYLKAELPKLAIKTLKIAAQEGGEEVAQGITQNLVTKWLDKETPILTKDLGEEFVAGFVASFPFGAAQVRIPKIEKVAPPIEPEVIPEIPPVEAKPKMFEGLFEKPEVKPEVVKPEVKPIPKPVIEVKPKVVKPLPEIKKPPIKKEVKLYVGLPDPGVDKFIAEEVRPALNKATEAGKYVWKTGKYIPELMMRVIEPAKLVAGEPYAAVIRGIHHPEARLVEFDQKRLKAIDTNISELEKWYNDNFSDKDLENLMLSRGDPISGTARLIQRDAIRALPKELRSFDQQKAIQEIADFNYRFLQKVAGKDIHKVEDYFYGQYGEPKMVDKFLDYWRSTKRFIKEKHFPTVADATEYGLELKHKNPVANLRTEFRAIAKLEGMTWMREELLRTGKGIYIEEIAPAPRGWEKVNDPVFKDLRVEPNLARLINNLISTNQITRIPPLNALRKINNFLRTLKFIGSGFHALVIAKQSLADSGWFGFAYKKTATKGATFGFRKDDPIFRTTEFKDYVALGGSHKYSIEFQAKRALSDAMDKIYRGNYLGAFTKFGILPTKIPLGFVNWMFNNYIPKVKYAKYLDFVVEKENKLGRMLTDKEKIEIIKEGQNFYGMMNERLFGRGATATTLLRFAFMAPGYAEGNYRTIIKAFYQWGIKGTYGAGRSRYNIVNSLLITGMMATVATLILTGKSPEEPKELEDIRDLFKIDTGKVDKKGRRIMIDLMTYDKDYWNVTFNVLRGRPDIAITESVKRVGGMKASTFGMLVDFGLMLQGQAIYDWKEDKVVEITDPFLLKVQKLAVHEVSRLEPISVSVYKQLREKEVDAVFAGIASMLGIRSTKTEADKRKQEITNRLFSLRDQQEQLYYYLGTIKDPKKAIEDYNKIVNDMLGAKMVPQEMRDEWSPKLLIDIDRLLSNKVYQLTGPMTTLTPSEKEKEIEKIKKYLKNFEVTEDELEKYLRYYWKEHPVKEKWSKLHQENIIMRKVRLKERY